jgi:hypothetical protein
MWKMSRIITRGSRAWHSADDFEEMERILQIFFRNEICSVGISAS